MFGRRKKSNITEESGQQSSLILDSLEMVGDEEEYEESLTQEEDLIADMFSDAEISEDGTFSIDHGFDRESDQEEEYPEETIEEEKPKRRGFFSFFRRPKKDVQLYDEEEAEEEYEEADEEYEDEEGAHETGEEPAAYDQAYEVGEERAAYDQMVETGEEPAAYDQALGLSDDLPGFAADDRVGTGLTDSDLMPGIEEIGARPDADARTGTAFGESISYGQADEADGNWDNRDAQEPTDTDTAAADRAGGFDLFDFDKPMDENGDVDWLAGDDDLELNPALFALADEIEDFDTSEEVEVQEEEDTEEAGLTDDGPDGSENTIGSFLGGLFRRKKSAPAMEEDESDESADDSDDEEYDEDNEEAGDGEDMSDDSYDEDGEEGTDEDDPLSGDDDGAKRKKILIGVGVAALAVILAAFFIFRNMSKTPEGKAYVQSVKDILGYDLGSTYNNRYSGIVEAQKQTKVTLEEGMTVAKCYVNVGDDVKKGDRLFKYDTEALNLQAQKKQLEIDQTNQKINSATKKKAEYDRDTRTKKGIELLEAQQGSQMEELNIENYKLDLQAKKKELNAINKNIKNSVVKSKTNGQVLKINTALGKGTTEDSDMESSSQENSDNSYMVIVAKGDYQIKVKVSETNMQVGEGIQKKGAKVIIRSRITDATWEGTVKSVRTDQLADEEDSTSEEDSMYSDSDSQEVDSKYPVIVSLTSSKGLMLGQHVLVEIDEGIEKSDEGTTIKLDASYVLEEGGNYYVYADNDGRLVKRAIKVGEFDEDNNQYEVTDGLTENDMIAEVLNCKEGMATTTNQDEEGVVNGESGDSDEEDATDDYFDEDLDDDLSVDGLEIDE